MATAYEGYQPLDESQQQIRLLTIHPSSTYGDSGIVTCTLEAIALRNANPFYALSYVWGPATPTNPISINGQNVNIRRNLWDFLQILRARFCHKAETGSMNSSAGSSLRVWADYICIQQNDTRERTYQVSMIGDVYNSADAIYAWLGESTTPLNDGMSCVTETMAMRQRNVPWIQILKQVGDVEARIRSIAISPYWTRMWIKQEALLARNLWFFHGLDAANWKDVLFVAKLCPQARANKHTGGSRRDSRNATDSAMRALLELRESQTVSSDLRVLMQKFADSQCQDARDRIYALLSLIDEDTKAQIVVDYDKPVFQVYLENYYHWTLQEPTRLSKTTTRPHFPIYDLDHFCANMNKTLPEADFELLCSSKDVRRGITARGLFTATNVSSVEWACAIATIEVNGLDPISRIHEVNTEGTAFVLRVSLRSYLSSSAAPSRQCFIYSNIVPNSNAIAVWIGSCVLFLQSSRETADNRAQALHGMDIVGTGTEIQERTLPGGRDDRLRQQFLQHPSEWLREHLADAHFEIERTTRRRWTDDILVICNAAAMVQLLRESRRNSKASTQSNRGKSMSYGEMANNYSADGQPSLWSPYVFGLEHKLLQPCHACRSSFTLPRWQGNAQYQPSCSCQWTHRTEC